MVTAVLQVIAAVVIVTILMGIALWQFYKERFNAIQNAAGAIKRTVVIFDGIKDFSQNQNEMYDLYNTNNINYMNLVNSVNQDSGLEYSYNFWLYIDQSALSGQKNSIFGQMNSSHNVSTDSGLDTSDRSLMPMVLFQRGDPRVFTYKSTCTGGYKTDAIVKNPIVKIENGGDVLSVEFNVMDHPDAHQLCPSLTHNTWPVANQQKVGFQGLSSIDALNAKWFMVTVVVQQTDPTTMLSNRDSSICTIYINGVKKVGPVKVTGKIDNVNSAVRSASGNLYVNYPLYSMKGGNRTQYSLSMNDTKGGAGIPTATINSNGTSDGKLMMANLTYYNYALGPGDVMGMFHVGYTNKPSPTITSTSLALGAGIGAPTNQPTPFDGAVTPIGGGLMA